MKTPCLEKLSISEIFFNKKRIWQNMKVSFEKKYPNITRWIDEHEGLIEIGYDDDDPLNSFIRAVDSGGTLWEGKESYESIDAALQDLNAGLASVLEEIYGE
jgi:hypothetical protein